MTYYWRARNIPELRDLMPKDRGRWWREAKVCSHTTRDGWVLGIVIFATISATDMLSDHLHSGVLARNVIVFPLGMAVAMAVELIYDAKSLQPRAREWLRANLTRQMAREQRLNAK